jgi:hypothetical protein
MEVGKVPAQPSLQESNIKIRKIQKWRNRGGSTFGPKIDALANWAISSVSVIDVMLKSHCGGWEIMSGKHGLYSGNWFLVFPPRTSSPVPWACTRRPPMYPSGILLSISETAPTNP